MGVLPSTTREPELPYLEVPAATPAPPVVNVATVPQRSLFRYPGGKTWLVPWIRQWLSHLQYTPSRLVEPFAGGGIVSLTAVFENLVPAATLIELDPDVASVWHTVLNGKGQALANRIASFEVSRESVAAAFAHPEPTPEYRAFLTILRNRINRGGILAPGAGVFKNGENGRGLASRWYPATLKRRILDIVAVSDRITFLETDGLDFLARYSDDPDLVFFIDPPYTVAGTRLYTHSDIDHERLFGIAETLAGDFLITYDDAPMIQELAAKHGFQAAAVAMRNTHHACKTELLIGRDLTWLTQ
ncbi:MAG: DNA adenine methylase [Armatimonadetes bacterium]|nr:DNA adenine methylase [Armatimonadota bacterium]